MKIPGLFGLDFQHYQALGIGVLIIGLWKFDICFTIIGAIIVYLSKKYMDHPKVHIIEAPIVEISSTFIRNSIKQKKDIAVLLPDKVWKYLDEMNFYK